MRLAVNSSATSAMAAAHIAWISLSDGLGTVGVEASAVGAAGVGLAIGGVAIGVGAAIGWIAMVVSVAADITGWVWASWVWAFVISFLVAARLASTSASYWS